MHYQARKLDEIATKIGISVAVLEQYLRAKENEMAPETSARPKPPRTPLRRPPGGRASG